MTRYEFTPRGMVPRKDGRWVHASDVEQMKLQSVKKQVRDVEGNATRGE